MSHAFDCLCAGIAVADHVCVPIERMPAAGGLAICERLDLSIGGCAANAAVDLARLGVKVAIAARVGDDVFGQFVRQTLDDAGVETDLLRVTPGEQTSGTLVINVRGEDRRFIHAFGANAAFDGSELTAEQIRDCRVLYVGGFFAMPRLRAEAVADWFRVARGAGVTTLLDVVIPGPGNYRRELETVLPFTDVFLPNDDEGRLITGLDDPVQQAEWYLDAGAKNVVVTCGGRGSVFVSAEERFRAGAFRVSFVDGTGSGDAFDAGYILGLLEGRDARGCIEWGSALGASCVQASGATTGVFNRAELEGFLKGNRLEFN